MVHTLTSLAAGKTRGHHFTAYKHIQAEQQVSFSSYQYGEYMKRLQKRNETQVTAASGSALYYQGRQSLGRPKQQQALFSCHGDAESVTRCTESISAGGEAGDIHFTN